MAEEASPAQSQQAAEGQTKVGNDLGLANSSALADADTKPTEPVASAEQPVDDEVKPADAVPQPVPKSPPKTSSNDPFRPPTPARRRPKPPTKGILKPPPPPAKPTLGNRLRDIVASSATALGNAKALFDPAIDEQLSPGGSTRPLNGDTHAAGPSAGPSVTPQSIGGTLNAIGGRLGLGISRLVAGASSPGPSTPAASPAQRSISLPAPDGMPVSEKSRQKQPLKRATFVLPTLSITYPISSQGEPWSIKVIEDRKRIETTHRSLVSSSVGAQYWTSDKLVALYENACRGREERSRVGIIRALETLPQPPRVRSIHITLRPIDGTFPPVNPPPYTTDVPLNRHAAEALADVLCVEWGLAELRLENGMLESEDALKPILHALLVSGTLPTLSLAGNKKIRSGGWKLLAVFLRKARSLRFLNLSDTSWDRKGVEHLVQALNTTSIRDASKGDDTGLGLSTDPSHTSDSPNGVDDIDEEHRDAYGSFIPPAPLLKEAGDGKESAAIQTLRMDGCGLRGGVLETLAQGIRTSDVKNISLRNNRIGPLGGVSLALMIRDYPDSALTISSLSPSLTSLPSMHSPSSMALESTLSAPATSYTAYVPRSRRPPATPTKDDGLPAIPLVTTTPGGGVTSRTLPDGYTSPPPPPPKFPLSTAGTGHPTLHNGPRSALDSTPVKGEIGVSEFGGASMALQRSVRALDGVERIGRLLTLDLKSNDIKNGVSYIAQVLKRNRTLKVLNLSDNKIEPAGLASLAEALKYNSSLETLDLSSNPCCSPSLEGVAALRTTFTVNTTLKRLFLSDTHLTTEGAIALAEFLPESKSLLHLDLTANPGIDTAGVLALSVGLKANTLIRCLDLSIPPNAPELAELSQSILQSCIRNTELAAEATTTKAKPGAQEVIWAPIKRSSLVKGVREADQARADRERLDQAQSPEGQAREYVYTLKPERVAAVAEETVGDLEKWYEAGRMHEIATSKRGSFHAWEPGQLPKSDFPLLYHRAKALKERVVELVQTIVDEAQLPVLIGLNDTLDTQITQGIKFVPPPRLLLPSQIVPTEPTPQPPPPSRLLGVRRHMRIPSIEISSPNFSIGDSDNDSDAEELDVSHISSDSITSPRKDLSTSPLATPTKGSFAASKSRGLGVGEVPTLSPGHPTSPVEKVSRAWVEEEGEIFRKGMKLGVADEENDFGEEDATGEELKQELLDTTVPRSPTRRVIPEPSETELEADLRLAMEDRDT